MTSDFYRFEETMIAPEIADRYQVFIVATEQRTSGPQRYPTNTFYKLVKIENRYRIYTYVIDHDTDRWAEREDNIPKRFTVDEVMRLWEEFKQHMKEGAEIGHGPVFWEVALNRQGKIIESVEEWTTVHTESTG